MELANYLLKSVAILSIFYIVYFVFLKKDTLFNAKRHFFLAGIIAALFFPFLEFTQIIYVEQPIAVMTTGMDLTLPNTLPSTSSMNNTPQEFEINWWLVALIVYTVGLIICLARLAHQLYVLLRLLKSYPSVKRGPYHFIEIDQNLSPFSFFRYIVYNPENHNEEELEMILKHEKVHATQWHSIDIISMHVLRAIQWMNPFSWWYKQSAEENLEFLADLHTVSQLPSKKQYQLTLVKASSPILAPALTTQFYQSFIKKRIIMLNTSTSKKHNLWKLSFVLPFLAFFLWSFNVTEEIHYTNPSEVGIETIKLPEFLITSETSDAELNNIEQKLTKQTPPLKVAFVDRKRNNQGKLTRLSIDTQFPGQPHLYKNVTYGGEADEIESVKLKMVEDDLQFASLDGSMIMRATPKGVVAVKFPKKEKESNHELKGDPLPTSMEQEDTQDPVQKAAPLTIAFNKGESITRAIEENSSEVQGFQRAAMSEPAQTIHATINSSFIAKSAQIKTTSSIQELRVSINKNTTDAELESLKKKAQEDHGVDLSYTVVRNSNREIISINLSYSGTGNSGSYNVNDDEPIDEFFFFAKDNGDLGFWSEAHEKRQKERELEHQARMEEHKERITEHHDRMEEHKERMTERKEEMEVRKSEMKERMEERKEEMRERQEELEKVHRQYRTDTRTSSNGNYSYTSQGNNPGNTVTITKNTSDEELASIKKKMASKNISFSYSKVRRNKNGELTGIKVVTDNGKGSKSSISTKTDKDKPIDALVIEM